MDGGETQTHAERLKGARQLGKGRRALELELRIFFAVVCAMGRVGCWVKRRRCPRDLAKCWGCVY
jgi:hypothetical protein